MDRRPSLAHQQPQEPGADDPEADDPEADDDLCKRRRGGAADHGRIDIKEEATN